MHGLHQTHNYLFNSGLVWLERSSPENALPVTFVCVSLGLKSRWDIHTQHVVCLQCQQPCPLVCISRMDACPCYGQCPWISFYLLDISLLLRVYAHMSSTELLKVIKGCMDFICEFCLESPLSSHCIWSCPHAVWMAWGTGSTVGRLIVYHARLCQVFGPRLLCLR